LDSLVQLVSFWIATAGLFRKQAWPSLPKSLLVLNKNWELCEIRWAHATWYDSKDACKLLWRLAQKQSCDC